MGELEGGNFTYLVRCADGSLYCGWTNHLEERVRAHNEGRGAKYTKSRRPVELVYFEVFASKREAMRREWEMKRMSRAEKMLLVKAFRVPDGQRGRCADLEKS